MDKTLCSPVSAVELSTPQTSREFQRNLSKVVSTSLSNTLNLLTNQSAPFTASAQPPLLSNHQTKTLPKLNSKPGVDTLELKVDLLAHMLPVTLACHPPPPSATITSSCLNSLQQQEPELMSPPTRPTRSATRRFSPKAHPPPPLLNPLPPRKPPTSKRRFKSSFKVEVSIS